MTTIAPTRPFLLNTNCRPFIQARSLDYRNFIAFASCGIGDVILATPLFANIKHYFPHSSMTLVLREDCPLDIPFAKGLVNEAVHCPSILFRILLARRLPSQGFFAGLKILAPELACLHSLRKRRFDLSFSLFPGGRYEALPIYCIGARRRVGPRYRLFGRTTGLLYTDTVVWDAVSHVVENNLDILRAIGLEPVTKELRLEPRDEDVRAADALMRANGVVSGDTLIGMHAGISRSRHYWPIERVVDVAGYLLAKPKVKVAIFIGPGEQGAADRFTRLPVIKIADRSFPMTCACLTRCSLVFTSDSMLGHAAAALQIPTVTIYGNGNQRKYNRWGVPDFSINKLPVSLYPGPEHDFWAGKHGKAALESVTVKEVIALFEKALAVVRYPSRHLDPSRCAPPMPSRR